MFKYKTAPQFQPEDQRGAALVMSILALLLATVIAFALVASGTISLSVSKNANDQAAAYYIAESGLSHAINLVKNANRSEYTSILQAGNGVANTGDELSTRPTALTPIPSTGLTVGSGFYTVRVADDPQDTDGNTNADSNGRLVITSTGFGPDGSTMTMEAIVYNAPGRPGILADGDIVISNGISVFGPSGILHANGLLNTSGNVCAENYIAESSSAAMNLSKLKTGTSCSTAAVSGTTNPPATALYSQPVIVPEIYDIPAIQTMFRPQADFIFKADGTIWAKGAGSAMTAAQKTAAGMGGWTWTSGSKQWSYSSSTLIADGVYYMEGSNMKITNAGSGTSPGTGGPSPLITFIAEGSISITNGANPGFVPKLPGWGMVSGNDIQISSKMGTSGTPALIYAYGQLQFTNQTTIFGWVQAANFRRPDGTNGPDALDPGGQNLVNRTSTGTIRVSNTTVVTTPTGSNSASTFAVLSRREVRN